MFSDSDVAQMLNDVDRLIDAGSSATAACRQIGISQQSYYRWRKERLCLSMGDPDVSRVVA
jgi:transposase-like protein